MSNLNGKNILIVEDDTLLSELLAKKFFEEKVMVDHASDGEMAISMINAKKYDLVLLDLLLPKVDGYAVMKNLNESQMSKGTPVIVFSNLGQKADVEKGMALGVKKFLVKAILSLDEVVEAVEDVFK